MVNYPLRIFDDPKNLVCIVGWQPPASLGNALSNGKDPVLVRYSAGREHKKEWISPVLKVVRVNSFSAHADQDGLVDWLSRISGVSRVFLVHGEYGSAKKLSERIENELGIDAKIPARGETVALAGADKDR